MVIDTAKTYDEVINIFKKAHPEQYEKMKDDPCALYFRQGFPIINPTTGNMCFENAYYLEQLKQLRTIKLEQQIVDGTFESAETGTTYVGINIKNSDITGSSFSSSNGAHTVYTEISDDGEFVTKGGTFEGEINTTSGAIGGMSIESDGIYSDNGSKSSGISSEDKNAFWSGATYGNRATAPFRVINDGTVFSKDIRVEDTSKNTSFSIIDSKITGTNADNLETVSISNTQDGVITLYDSNSENPLTLSSSEINLSNPNSHLIVNGTKSRITKTENYNNRLLYCYETSTPLFGDIGSGEIDDTGECLIYIDPIFAETINTDKCNYQVFVSPYGRGELYVSARTSEYFIVSGTPGLEFAWELKAKQRDYETLRLDEYIREDIENE